MKAYVPPPPLYPVRPPPPPVQVITVKLIPGGRATKAQWQTIRSRIEFQLAQYAPMFEVWIGEVDGPRRRGRDKRKRKDTKCPRQEGPLRAEDMI